MTRSHAERASEGSSVSDLGSNRDPRRLAISATSMDQERIEQATPLVDDVHHGRAWS
jgi:hypothetical protein